MGNKGVTLWKDDGEQKDVGVTDGQVENFQGEEIIYKHN